MCVCLIDALIYKLVEDIFLVDCPCVQMFADFHLPLFSWFHLLQVIFPFYDYLWLGQDVLKNIYIYIY